MSGFLNWDTLLSFSGCAMVVTAVTQVLKQYIRANPKSIALVVAGIIVFGVQLLYHQNTTPQGIFLAAINWILMAGTATGVFEYAVKPFESFFEEKNDETMPPE